MNTRTILASALIIVLTALAGPTPEELDALAQTYPAWRCLSEPINELDGDEFRECAQAREESLRDRWGESGDAAAHRPGAEPSAPPAGRSDRLRLDP